MPVGKLENVFLKEAERPGRTTEVNVSGSEPAKLLKASYKTRGKKMKQEDLFPDLCSDIEKAKTESDIGIIWPDQNAEVYKKKVKEVGTPLIGKQLTEKQRASFAHRILYLFSARFWLPGCPAPRVTNYEAEVDAQPKCIQPYMLRKFDQLRLEFHEDQEVKEGKSEWVMPGDERMEWGAPSFVVSACYCLLVLASAC